LDVSIKCWVYGVEISMGRRREGRVFWRYEPKKLPLHFRKWLPEGLLNYGLWINRNHSMHFLTSYILQIVLYLEELQPLNDHDILWLLVHPKPFYASFHVILQITYETHKISNLLKTKSQMCSEKYSTSTIFTNYTKSGIGFVVLGWWSTMVCFSLA
jgi:hypothetical protein